MHSRRSRRRAGSPRSHSGSRRCRGRSPRRHLISPATTAPTCTTIPACGARRAEPPEEAAMTIEDKLAKAGLTIPNLEDLYRTNATGAAIGCRGLGGKASVEIIATVLFTGSDVRPPLARDHFQK